MGGKFLLELPAEIALFWLFKVLLLIHKLNESPLHNPWAEQSPLKAHLRDQRFLDR
jgi:hypothetical protein